MKICNYQVGDLLLLERRRGNNELWIVLGELSCTIRVKNVVPGKEYCMPPDWFTKL